MAAAWVYVENTYIGGSSNVRKTTLRDREQQLQAVLDMSQAGIIMTIANEWTISFSNKRMEELFECTESELGRANLTDFLHPADNELVKMNMDMMITGEIDKISSEVQFIRKNGVDFWGSFSAVRLERDDESVQGIMVTIHDITEQREAERMISIIESNYWEIFNSTNDALFVHDAYTGAILDVNRTVEKMYGYTREEIFFMNFNDLSAGEPPHSLNEAVQMIRKTVEEGPQTHEWLGKKKGGELFWAEVSLTASHIGGEGRVLAVIRDIADRKEIEKRFQYLSSHDSLTGLYNRAHFETEFERASRGRSFPISVIVADLDGLKAVNDTHGHVAGDLLIKAAAAILRNAFRPDDLVARVGGDEFAVLLTKADYKTTASALERIRTAELRLREENGPVQVCFSLGSATATVPEEIGGLMNRADIRMYEEKTLHKQSCVVGSVYSPSAPPRLFGTTLPQKKPK
jgi:diguanylate cyclase (GGDEF)-like protein/PAS domain S-box-containing protein